MSQCLPAVWPVCKQLCCWCQLEPPGVSPRVCFVRAKLSLALSHCCECLSAYWTCCCFVVWCALWVIFLYVCFMLFIMGVFAFHPRPHLCACVFCVSMCVRVCVCLTSHLGELTEWRICAVIVVWLSSCCNWKCLIGETFVKMFIRACHLTLTQLLLLPVQLLKCSPPLTLDVEPVPSWNWVNYHTNCLVWTACS